MNEAVPTGSERERETEKWEELRRAAAELWDEDPETWPEHGNAPLAIAAGIALANGEIDRLRRWVDDLQSGMYVNCVYCGHRYGPGETTPVTMADALKAHIEECPRHPMGALRAEIRRLRTDLVHTEQDAEALRSQVGSLRAALAGSGERNEYLSRKMKELADATRKASKLLPDRPITGEVVACAGIMAMANLLDEVSAALSREPLSVVVLGEWDETCDHDCSHHGAEGPAMTLPDDPANPGRPRWPLLWVCDGCGTLMAKDARGVTVPVRARLLAASPLEAEKHDICRAEIAHRDEKVSELQELLQERTDGAWVWETDGDNDLASLTGPILITAEALRGLIAPPEASEEHACNGPAGTPCAICGSYARPVPPVEPEGGRKRCAEIAPDGYQRCADFDGHGGNHTLLAPSGAPWFDGRPEGDER